jgi:hypothetical protein
LKPVLRSEARWFSRTGDRGTAFNLSIPAAVVLHLIRRFRRLESR